MCSVVGKFGFLLDLLELIEKPVLLFLVVPQTMLCGMLYQGYLDLVYPNAMLYLGGSFYMYKIGANGFSASEISGEVQQNRRYQEDEMI